MVVSQLINDRGNAVANQFVLTDNKSVSFQSYASLVCKIEADKITFGCDWDYSRTTMKHLNTFLRDNDINVCGSADIRKLIKAGSYYDKKVVYDENMI